MAVKCPSCQFDNTPDSKFCKECGTQLTPSEKSQPTGTKTLETPIENLTRGTLFANRYEIIEELGRGGMGAVYRVEDTKIGQEIALKLIKPEIASDKKTIERFRNELKITRMISHRNVCRMFDLGDFGGAYFITMEYVTGGDLKNFIQRSRRLDAGTAIAITKQVCEGLSEAHRLGVVHRDLKSSNIMIDKTGNARIMDFGIARSQRAKGLTGEGIIIGTPEYMSPEQAESKDIDSRTDIYSLGVILYEMVTGQLPFEGDTPLSIVMKHKGEVPKEPKTLNPQISDELNQLILRCMEKDKSMRFQSAEELHADLETLEKSIPTAERKILKKKPTTSREITVTLGLKKLFIPALVILVCIILGLILWHPWKKEKPFPLISDKPSLAVMYFENNTGDQNLNHWGKMFSDLLITDLSQSKYLKVLSGERLFQILDDLHQIESKAYSADVLKEVAVRGGVDYLLSGKYFMLGDVFRIDIQLQKAKTGEIIRSEREEATGEKDIWPKLDELTKKIKESFNLSPEQIANDFDKDLGNITTNSPEAFKYFSEGWKYHIKGEYREGILLFKKAVEIDPEFAMAYRAMGAAYFNLNNRTEGSKYLKKALELSDRVSDRERYQIQGKYYYRSEGTYDKTIEIYSKLIKLWPDDIDANLNLGSLYSRIDEWDKALERFNTLSKDSIESNIELYNLIRTYRAKGMYDKARELNESYIANTSDKGALLGATYALAYNHLFEGKLGQALGEANKIFLLDPSYPDYHELLGLIFHLSGDLDKAEQQYQTFHELKNPGGLYRGRKRLGALYLMQGKLKKSMEQMKLGIELANQNGQPEEDSWFRLGLSYLLFKCGKFKEALEELEKIWQIALEKKFFNYQRDVLFWKSLVYLEMGSIDMAQTTANELKEMLKKGLNKKLLRNHHLLMGMIEFKKKNFSEAEKYFIDALALAPYNYGFFLSRDGNLNQAVFIDPLALTYYKSGNLEKAREEYERIISLTTGRIYYGDIYTKAFHMLGKIYEQQGDTERAIENYERFLNLWKDADPGIAEVEDARGRLQGLLRR